MPDLTTGAVSLFPTSLREAEYYNSMKGVFTRRIKITNATVGGATNRITAASLGFKKLVDCGDFYRTDGTPAIYNATVDPVNNIILLGAGAAGAIGDMTAGTGYIVVTGT